MPIHIIMVNYKLNPIALDSFCRELMPEAPQFSSCNSGINNLFLAHYCHSPYEIPDHEVPMHVLEVIHTATPIHHRRRLGEQTMTSTLDHGDAFFYPAQIDHGVSWDETAGFTLIIFHPAFFEDELGCDRAYPFIKKHDPALQFLSQQVIADVEAGCPQGSLYTDAYALTLGHEIVKHLKAGTPLPKEMTFDGLSTPVLKRVQNYMHAKVVSGEPISMLELSVVARVSQSHFLRLFKAGTGRSPHAYYDELRMNHAVHLLKTTQDSIAQIAVKCGFNDHSYFSRRFKKVFKISPSQFRQDL